MGKQDKILEQIRAALSPHGIFLRGVLNFENDGPEMPQGRAASVVLLGNAGGSMWPAFSEWRTRHPDVADPLDAWSVALIRPLAEALGGTAWFPSDRPWQPFQQWAMRAEGLKPSPLGILIHPDYGLWHGYRGAIGFLERMQQAVPVVRPHPCDHCPDTPCLTTCPVGAVTVERFDVAACRSHLGAVDPLGCMSMGCLARNACPVGAQHRYPEAQLRFHMQALWR